MYVYIYIHSAYPITPSFHKEVNHIIGNLTTEHMKKNLKTFTSFTNLSVKFNLLLFY